MSDETVKTPQTSVVRYILLAVLALGVLATGFILASSVSQLASPPAPTPLIEGITAIEPPEPLGDFTLTDQNGQPASLSDLRGKLTLLFFGYTHCPDYCPTTLDDFKRIRAALGEDAGEVNFVFVSVDGARDTPDAIRSYFDVRGVSDFVTGMTGSADEVQRAGQPFGVFFEVNPGTADSEFYLVDHSTLTYLIDREGRLRALYSFHTPIETVVAHLRAFL